MSAEVARLREEQSLKRKQSEEEQIQQNDSRKKRRQSILAKCSEELKCTICDELFISVTLILLHIVASFVQGYLGNSLNV